MVQMVQKVVQGQVLRYRCSNGHCRWLLDVDKTFIKSFGHSHDVGGEVFCGRQKDTGKGRTDPCNHLRITIYALFPLIRSPLSLHFMVGAGSVALRVSHTFTGDEIPGDSRGGDSLAHPRLEHPKERIKRGGFPLLDVTLGPGMT